MSGRWDGKQSGKEQDAVSRDGGRWKQRPRSGKGREVAVGNEILSGFPFPSRPVPDPTIIARTLIFCFFFRRIPPSIARVVSTTGTEGYSQPSSYLRQGDVLRIQ